MMKLDGKRKNKLNKEKQTTQIKRFYTQCRIDIAFSTGL